MEVNYNKIIQEKGIRPSVQRTVIFEYLHEHPIHPTVDDVYTALSPDYPTLSRTTVYNTLKLFVQNGLVQVVKIEDDELRYDATTKPHIHFKCEKCGKIYDIMDDEAVNSFATHCTTIIPHGFKINTSQTNLWGICEKCASEN